MSDMAITTNDDLAYFAIRINFRFTRWGEKGVRNESYGCLR